MHPKAWQLRRKTKESMWIKCETDTIKRQIRGSGVRGESLTWVRAGQDIPCASASLPWMGQGCFLPSHSSWTHISNWNRKQREQVSRVDGQFLMRRLFFFLVTLLKLNKCQGEQLENKQAYLSGPTLTTGAVCQQHLNYDLLSQCFCCQPPVSGGMVPHVRTTGAVRGSSQSLFGVGQRYICTAITHSWQTAPGRGSASPQSCASKSDQAALTPLSWWAMSLKQDLPCPTPGPPLPVAPSLSSDFFSHPATQTLPPSLILAAITEGLKMHSKDQEHYWP